MSCFVISLQGHYVSSVVPNKAVTSTTDRTQAARFATEDEALVRKAGLVKHWQDNATIEPYEPPNAAP